MKKKELTYTPRKVERAMYEDDVDNILVEGLAFHKEDYSIDKDIVDVDPQPPGSLIAEFMGEDPDHFDFLGIGKNKTERKERREHRKDQIRKVFDKVKDAAEDVGQGVKRVAGDVADNVKQGVKDVKKDPVKAIKKGLKEVAKVIVKGAYAVPRAAYLGILALNFRGQATQLAYADADTKNKAKKAWEKFGGEGGNLMAAADAGKNKPAIICGIKCKAKVRGSAKSSFDGQLLLESNAYNKAYSNVTGADDIVVSVATASPVIASLAAILAQARPAVEDAAKIAKAISEVKAQDEMDKKDQGAMPQSEVDSINKAFNELAKSMSPEEQIKNNPNLTDEEKKAALAELGADKRKKILIGLGIAVVVITLIVVAVKMKGSQAAAPAPAPAI